MKILHLEASLTADKHGSLESWISSQSAEVKFIGEFSSSIFHRQKNIYMKKSKANFQYKIGEWNGQKLLLIIDKDSGGMSVTNDLENVVSDIATHEGIDPKDYFIAYRDSEQNWDGWDAKTGSFFFFRELPNKALDMATKELPF